MSIEPFLWWLEKAYVCVKYTLSTPFHCALHATSLINMLLQCCLTFQPSTRATFGKPLCSRVSQPSFKLEGNWGYWNGAIHPGVAADLFLFFKPNAKKWTCSKQLYEVISQNRRLWNKQMFTFLLGTWWNLLKTKLSAKHTISILEKNVHIRMF